MVSQLGTRILDDSRSSDSRWHSFHTVAANGQQRHESQRSENAQGGRHDGYAGRSDRARDDCRDDDPS